MNYGIKLWSTNTELFDLAVDLIKTDVISFIELKIILGKTDSIDILKNVPTVLHTQNCVDGLCFSDSNLDKNLDAFKQLEKIASSLNSKGVIIHPGIGNKSNLIEFLKNINTNKLIIENMPRVAIGGTGIGYTPGEIKELLGIGDFRFCLDFCHAIKAATSLNLDYKKLINEFLTLNPAMFHICDGFLSNEKDEHLNLGKGDFDLKFCKNIIKDSRVTFEVPKTTGLDNDLKNVEFFKRI